jgi:excinuclease ABC subunit A
MAQLHGLVQSGNTVIVVEHDMRVVAGSDWVIDIGPGAGDEGGKIVAAGQPAEIAAAADSRTAPYLRRFLDDAARARCSDIATAKGRPPVHA